MFQELKRSIKKIKILESEADDFDQGDSQGTIPLYGKWQLEPLQLPRAVDGIVPKVSSFIFYFIFIFILSLLDKLIACSAQDIGRNLLPSERFHNICFYKKLLILIMGPKKVTMHFILSPASSNYDVYP